jgi:hypothetical protein
MLNFLKMAKEISKVVKLQVREVLRIHRHRLDLLLCQFWQFNAELAINQHTDKSELKNSTCAQSGHRAKIRPEPNRKK